MVDRILGISVGILTVSDSCFSGEKIDTSGLQLQKHITHKTFGVKVAVIRRCCVPDNTHKIQTMIRKWSDDNRLNLILTVGGTGFSTQDVTPEATKQVVDFELEHLASAMVLGCLKKTTMSMLSRSTCGVRCKSLIINLPGSVKASQECFDEISTIVACAIQNLMQDASITDIELIKPMDVCGDGDVKSKVDISNIAERPRQSSYPMISVTSALATVLHHSDFCNTKRKYFRDCINHILAEDVIASEPFPLFPASIKDGYAVIAEDLSDVRNVIWSCTPGYLPGCVVTVGNCVRVSTGGAIPDGANAVVQVEDTVVVAKDKEGKEELKIKILKQPVLGQDIRTVGSDIAKGEILIPKCKKVLATEIGIMSMNGIQSSLVYEKPCVAVLSTGNELVEPESTPKPGCIRDSNKNSLLHILSQCCIPCIDVGIAKDTPDDVKSRLMLAFDCADVVISTGGVSMGERDCLKEVLKIDFDAPIHFGRIHMKPGKPTTFSTLSFKGKKKLIFSLPGNPVSAIVTFYLFVIPCLRKLMGFKDVENRIVKAKINHDLNLDERPEFHRASVKYCNDALTYIATSTGNQRSSRLSSVIGADAVLVLPARTNQQTKITEGSIVDAILLECI